MRDKLFMKAKTKITVNIFKLIHEGELCQLAEYIVAQSLYGEL